MRICSFLRFHIAVIRQKCGNQIRRNVIISVVVLRQYMPPEIPESRMIHDVANGIRCFDAGSLLVLNHFFNSDFFEPFRHLDIDFFQEISVQLEFLKQLGFRCVIPDIVKTVPDTVTVMGEGRRNNFIRQIVVVQEGRHCRHNCIPPDRRIDGNRIVVADICQFRFQLWLKLGIDLFLSLFHHGLIIFGIQVFRFDSNQCSASFLLDCLRHLPRIAGVREYGNQDFFESDGSFAVSSAPQPKIVDANTANAIHSENRFIIYTSTVKHSNRILFLYQL